MDELNDLLQRIRMPEDASAVILETAEKLPKALVNEARETFFAGNDIRPMVEAYAAESGIAFETLLLTLFLSISDRTKANYALAGWPEQLFYDTMEDYTVWAKTGMRALGYYGLPRQHDFWLEKHLRRELVRFGRMQFEPSAFMLDEYDGDTVHLKKGDPIINVHIPEGEPFTKEKRYASYGRAAEFFGTDLFASETWLFYPPHREILKPTSNIISFMDDFVILHTFTNNTLDDAWRVFGFRESYDPAQLPRDTSMQRAYADHIAKTGQMGGGYGIMRFVDGKCIKP